MPGYSVVEHTARALEGEGELLKKGGTYMNNRKMMGFVLLLIVFISFSFAQNGLAIVERMNLKQLTDESEKIVVGTVKDVNSRWETESGGNLIFTYVSIGIETYVKGVGTDVITIKIPGGKVGDINQEVSDTPRFELNEKVLLFLQQGGLHQVVGGYQGKFVIQGGKVLGQNIPVDEFIGRIRTLMQESSPESSSVQKDNIPLALQKPPQVMSASINEYPDQETPQVNSPIGASAGWNTIMSENFEGSFPTGLWQLGGNPTWGTTNYKPHGGAYSAWCARGGQMALILP
jgi:hypothetical protein